MANDDELSLNLTLTADNFDWVRERERMGERSCGKVGGLWRRGSRCAMRIWRSERDDMIRWWLKTRPLADVIDELIHYSWRVKTEWINLGEPVLRAVAVGYVRPDVRNWALHIADADAIHRSHIQLGIYSVSLKIKHSSKHESN